MDLFSRKILAWVLSDTLEAKHVVEAIEKAKRKRAVDKRNIMHTNRGILYICNAYQKATEGWARSYSKKAYPWDNACMESFHALIKREWINRFNVMDYHHAYKLIFEYKVIHIGDNVMGGGNPSFIPSMTTTKTEDRKATVSPSIGTSRL